MIIKFKEYDIMATPEEVYKLMNLAVEKMKEKADVHLEEVPEKPKQIRNRPKHYKTELDIPKMKALRKAGWSLSKIADEMRCSPQTVCRKLKEA